MDPVLLLKKLTEYACELKKLVEETKQAIKERQNLYDFTSYLHLKESSMILSKFLARIIKIRYEIQELPEHRLCTLQTMCGDEQGRKSPLDEAHDAVFRAQVLLDILDAKLSCLGEAYPRFVTNECVNDNSNVIPSKELSLPSIVETVIERSKQETSNVDSEELETNGDKGTAQLNTSSESSLQSAGEGKLSRRMFEMKRFTGSGDVREFVSFMEELQETIDQSPLSNEYKFAALRSLVRGEPYRLLLDINYRCEEAYNEAWNRLFSKYADDELVRRNAEREKVVRSLPANVENQSGTDPEEWSDTYFFEKYCKSVPNYKVPDKELVVKAIIMFLKFYTEGPSSLSTENLASVWLILLHGTFKSNYHTGGTSMWSWFKFGSKETTFSDLHHVFCHTKFGLNECREFIDPTFNVDTRFAKVEPWINFWVQSLRDKKFVEENIDPATNYFALLSMVLFRVKFTSSESVERFLNVSFEVMVSTAVYDTYDFPKIIPPHPDVYHFMRTSLFEPSGSALQTYLTYLVGFYCLGDMWVRNFVASGCCLPFIQRVSAGSIYWLEKAAASAQMKPRNFLEFLLVDPSMEVSAVKIHKVLGKYENQLSWRWARLFENHRLTELTVAENLELSHACFIFDLNRTETEDGKEYPEEFSRFINDADPPSLTGKNLGIYLREMLRTYSSFQME